MTAWDLKDLAGTEVLARLTQRGVDSEIAQRLVYLRNKEDDRAISKIVEILDR